MATIMVVDDSKTVRSYHGSILKSMGMDVLEAENGMEALEKTSECKYDMCLVDINMPILDGYSFVKRLRENDGFDIPIVMISTEAEQNDITIAYNAGANLYQVKPVSTDELITSANLLTIDKE